MQILIVCFFAILTMNYAYHHAPTSQQCRSCIMNPANRYCQLNWDNGYCCSITGENIYVCQAYSSRMCSNTYIYNEEYAEFLICPHEDNQCGSKYHDIKDTDSFYLETRTLLKSDSLCNYELYANSEFTGLINITVEESNNVEIRVYKGMERFELLGLVEENQSQKLVKSEFNRGQWYHVQVMSDGEVPHAKIKIDALSRSSISKQEAQDLVLEISEVSNTNEDEGN